MIEIIFSIDYEIYGNGEGRLDELVHGPTQTLMEIFNNTGNKFVIFAEVAEFERLAQFDSDPAIYKVHDQLRDLHEQGHEIALHLHPQWYRATYENGEWQLDYSEYNLCTLSRHRIDELVTRSIQCLRDILEDPEYTPLSFRAGNWLFQPTANAAQVLAEKGLKLDSSVFKGGRQHKHGLDYRPANKNGYWWPFSDNVNEPDNGGAMIEIPIHTEMVPPWKMLTTKRLGLQKKSGSNVPVSIKDKIHRFLDRARMRQPLKLDFCRMTLAELTRMVNRVIEEDRKSSSIFKPIVAIGHSKDLVDFETVEAFLSYLARHEVPVSTFQSVYPKCAQP